MQDDNHDDSGNKQKEVITPEVISDAGNQEKKKRYSKSRKGMGGRPVAQHDLDRPVVINFIQYLLKRGDSDSQIARLVNVPHASFARWKKRNLELWNEAENNSENPIKDIEKALTNKAKGFWVERPMYDKAGNFIRTKFQYYPPDNGAIQYYLNNRAPADWKQKVEHNHTIDELPMAINFVRKEKKKVVKAVTDDFGNLVTLDHDETKNSG